MRGLRLGMGQINTTVGEFAGNLKKIRQTIGEARSLGVDLLTFPELAICGYPPEDLLLKPQFIEENCRILEKVIEDSRGISLVVGFIDAHEDIYNAAAVIHDGKLVGIYHKIFLPNYGVFDENRYFQAGRECPVYTIGGVNIGVNICEDIWYESGPTTSQAYAGAELIVNISASPYYYGRGYVRERMLATRAADNIAIVAYNNTVGGQDELVFDGNSLVLDEQGRRLVRGKSFEEDLVIADLDAESIFRTRLHDPRWRKEIPVIRENRCRGERVVVSEKPVNPLKPALPEREVDTPSYPADVYQALVLGTRDYIQKNSFQKVVLGLSGGIDSSLVAAIAADALGAPNVKAVNMPSRYSSRAGIAEAELAAANLGINLLMVPIEKPFEAYLDVLREPCKGTRPDVAEENIQARIRGNILMALSNKFGWIVLNTGNKSEFATGYTTLYGDMAGGFAVIKDVPKTLVYELARYRNSLAGRALIPESVITKAPSAELRPEQKDVDTLPPYEILDPILKAYVEEDKSIDQIVALGFDPVVVRNVAWMVDYSEYKRRQSPPGIKITPRAFGRDRRLPITNHFRGETAPGSLI